MSQVIDKKAVAASFSKAARHYDQFAQLQRDIGEQLLVKVTQKSAINIVDLGCGTGYFSEKLYQQFPASQITCFDLSDSMLQQAKNRNIKNALFQLGDIDALPFLNNSVDLIYSNLVVQWSESLADCLLQIKSSLKQGGRCYLSTLGEGTLVELTKAWEMVDENPHTNTFLSAEVINTALKECAFSSYSVKTETRVLQYENVIEVMRALKGIGANHVHQSGAKQSTVISGRSLLKQLTAGYKPFTNRNGTLNLTYQVCYIEVIK